ncbi:MAG: pitrilysin family protein, partial [candidate division WOR-3 bacterium]
VAGDQGARLGIERGVDHPVDGLSWGSSVALEFYRLLLGNHPYGHDNLGDTISLSQIRRDDLLAFHSTYFVPNNCFIVVVGDANRGDVLKQIQARFGTWASKQVPELKVESVPVPGRLKVKLISRPEMNQTYIQFGHPGIARSDPDWLANRLQAYVLGGSALGSRLGDEVREKAGLAYDVNARFDEDRYPGAFEATVQTAKPKEALRLMFEEIRKMHDQGATRSELQTAQSYFSGSFPIRYSSNQGKLDVVTTIELHHLGLDWLERYPKLIQSVTLDEVNKAAREHLYPGRYVMVVMGNTTKEELGLSDVEWID